MEGISRSIARALELQAKFVKLKLPKKTLNT